MDIENINTYQILLPEREYQKSVGTLVNSIGQISISVIEQSLQCH